MREALNWEPIREFWRNNSGVNWDELETAIKEALAQPEQEPVGEVLNEKGEVDWISFVPPIGASLYTTPQPAVPERNPLSDEEIEAISDTIERSDFFDCVVPFARAIEAAHGIKG